MFRDDVDPFLSLLLILALEQKFSVIVFDTDDELPPKKCTYLFSNIVSYLRFALDFLNAA